MTGVASHVRGAARANDVSFRWAVGLALFTAMASLPALHLALYQERGWALLGSMGVAVATTGVVRRQAWLAAAAVIATSGFLQLGYIGIGHSDQVDLGRYAFERVFVEGESPYGVLYTNETGGLNPFAYGPLAMLTALGGVPLELLASLGLLGTIALTRSWLTLCVVSGFPPYIYQAPTGINDYSVSLLLLGGWLALRSRPHLGMVLLALAAAIKPYVAAWFLPAIGLAGWGAALWLVGVSALLWSPVLAWGIGSYVESLRLVVTASAPSGWPSNTISLPWVRWLAFPVAVAGLFVRRWDLAILLGSGAFVAIMFFGEWASLGYWVAVLPVTGITVERALAVRLGYRTLDVSP